MSERVYSFSVKELNSNDKRTIERIKLWCLRNRFTFSHIVIAALKQYEETTLNSNEPISRLISPKG